MGAMRHIHLDPMGGAAGDMFIAAMLDAAPELEVGMLDAIARAGTPGNVHCKLTSHHDGAFVGKRFAVVETRQHLVAHGGQGGHMHRHRHVSHADVQTFLRKSTLPEAVRDHALKIFALLAQAESRIHGMSVEDVSFHELGEWDSIADIVGAAYLIEQFSGCTWSCGALPMGRGRVKSAHGWLPVPAPAVSLLLEGMSVIDDGLDGERVTPTGAAILRYLKVAQDKRRPRMRMVAMGVGFGQRSFPQMSNVLRVLTFRAEEAKDPEHEAPRLDTVAVIQFEVDDQSGEDLAAGLERLRRLPGVIDVIQMPAFGKKGRMTAHIQVLAGEDATDAAAAACFAQTTTLGLRIQHVERRGLARRLNRQEFEGAAIGVKIATRPGGTSSAKAEADELAARADTQAAREALRRGVESAALKKESGHD